MSATAPQGAEWPESVFAAPLFRGLDARARRELAAAGRTLAFEAGAQIYAQGATSEAFFVVASGVVELCATRGNERWIVRRARAGETFGEEATVVHRRQAEARAEGRVVVAEVPVHLYKRAAVRSGQGEQAARLERTLMRAVGRDVLAGTALAQSLDEAGLDTLLDAVTFHSFARGQVIYRQGDASQSLFFVGDGLVQLQTEDDEGHTKVRGYLARGDFFGDEELELATARAATAVANGPSTLLALPARVVRSLAAQDIDLFARLRRVTLGLAERQEAVVGRAAEHATQHVFRDLYRVQIARSLLVIDLDSCVRCGHCAWACGDVHGQTRLVRTGDRVVTTASRATRAENLLMPSSCQHCENPACMVDCPTGAIGKDPGGEVFIREELCTGCGACARACPWDNIQIAPRPADAPRPEGLAAPALAVKCDLCRDYERGPACVAACPVEAIARVDPESEWSDVAAFFGAPPANEASPDAGATRARAPAWPWLLGATLASAALGLYGVVMHARGHLVPSRGAGWLAGWAGAALCLALVGYAAPKRGVRRWMRALGRRDPTRAPKRDTLAMRGSVTRPHYVAHLALGLACIGVVLVHARPVGAQNALGAALLWALAAAGASGIGLALAYVGLPPVLSRLERHAALPEDLAAEREHLITQLYKGLSGRDALVKAVAEKVLLPYMRSPLAALSLLLSRRDLRAEEQRLRDRIDAALEGRGRERLGGVRELCRTAVEIRALPLVRALSFGLRALLPVHIALFAVALALLAAHVALDGLGLGRGR